jgi:hypothetical protein
MEMAKAPKKAITGEVLPPDFEAAMSLYNSDIIPANRSQKQAMKEQSDAWKIVKKDHRVHKGGFQKAMQLCEMEEAEAQAWARSFMAGLKARGFVLFPDMVDQAEQGAEATLEIVPTGERPKIEMMSVN